MSMKKDELSSFYLHLLKFNHLGDKKALKLLVSKALCTNLQNLGYLAIPTLK
jgi:hypothetical protein